MFNLYRINSIYCSCKNIPIHQECLQQVITHNNIYCVYCNKKSDFYRDYLLDIIDLAFFIFQNFPNVFTLFLVLFVLQLVSVLYIINIISNNENRFILLLLIYLLIFDFDFCSS